MTDAMVDVGAAAPTYHHATAVTVMTAEGLHHHGKEDSHISRSMEAMADYHQEKEVGEAKDHHRVMETEEDLEDDHQEVVEIAAAEIMEDHHQEVVGMEVMALHLMEEEDLTTQLHRSLQREDLLSNRT